MPAPVEPVHLLALLTRVRAQRVAAGELAPGRLYDVRAFKSAYAELGYLRRLAAAGRAGGTVVTSFRQLVAGLAALHPAWRIDGGEGFEDRDRHQSAVRRRLDALQAMGLLRWRIGTDLDGEERRTELELRPAPEVSAEELQAAARHLERWQARYGPALNTGSKTGIRNAAGHGRPLSASERQRRGCQRARAAAASRRRVVGGSQSNSAPPFGAPATPENNLPVNTKRFRTARRLSKNRRDAREAHPQLQRASAALDGVENDRRRGGGGAVGRGGLGGCGGALWARLRLLGGRCGIRRRWWPGCRERELQRRPVLEAIAGQARERAAEVAGWGLERSWPFSRLREAWVVARHGPIAAADSGPAGAGPLYPDDYARLRRAVARYERNHTAAPDGYPAGGLAALLHLGALAGAGELPRRTADACATPSARSISSPAGCARSPPPTAPLAATVPLSALGAGASPRRGRCSSSFRAKWPPWVAHRPRRQPGVRPARDAASSTRTRAAECRPSGSEHVPDRRP